MLEVKNLVKEYKTKGGVVTKALDDVSIVFPETGMIFLLGKSGSGKSTLLNVIGGLDRPDKGEIIIKGRNSKSFSASDFDSYRNTYIGFIFQEYNILNEFNVEQNISLALQLQGKPNDKKTVEELLEQVDLQGYGKRKPNTLSGGQKQRVAIARALIKSPEIIMADEPTGALDSNTGKQVFDTLKKLSETKLVIVVSHDRDFAEYYGDRIIELSDGKIISDVTKESIQAVSANENIQIINENTVAIKDTSKLTKEDLLAIYKALKNNQGEAIISSGEHDLGLVKQAIHINSDNSSDTFHDTTDVEVKEYDGKQTKFIRSHLPFARAFKMGSSSLKTKPVRLIFTAFLTAVSLTMFGLTSTFMLFKDSYSLSRSLQKSGRVSEAIQKQYKYTSRNYRINNNTEEKEYDENEDIYEYYRETMLSEEDLSSLNNNSAGLSFGGVYRFYNQSFEGIDISELNQDYYLRRDIDGFLPINNEVMNRHNLSIAAGNLPANSNQIMISQYVYDIIKAKYPTVTDYSGIVGKEYNISLAGYNVWENKTFTISGVLNVGDIPSEYEILKNTSNSISDNRKEELKDRLGDLLNASYHTLIYTHTNFYDDIYYPIVGKNSIYEYYGKDMQYMNMKGFIIRENEISDDEKGYVNDIYDSYLADVVVKENKDDFTFYNLNGEETTMVENFGEHDIYVPYERFRSRNEEAYWQYFNKARDLLNCVKYDPDLYNLIITQDKRFEYEATIDRLCNGYVYDDRPYEEGCDKDEDFTLIKNFLDTYYKKIKIRQYTFELADHYINKYCDAHSWDESQYSVEFKEFRDKYYAMNTDPIDLTNFNDIVSYLESDTSDYVKIYNLFYWADRLDNLSSKESMVINSFRDKYWNNQTISTELQESVRDIILIRYPDFVMGYSTVLFTDPVITFQVPKFSYYSYKGNEGEFNVVGYYQYGKDSWGPYIVNKQFIKNNAQYSEEYTWGHEDYTDYVANGTNKYSWAITRSTYSQNQIEVMRKDFGSYRYSFNNRTTYSLDYILSLIALLKNIFLGVGIAFAVFAALMLLNFITTSITAKTKDIGILRAVGARGSDLFKIFFSESGLIVIICLVIALAASIAGCIIFNNYMMKEVGIAMLDFGILNIAIMVGGAFLIAFLGTFFPVLRASRKPPVESIRVL